MEYVTLNNGVSVPKVGFGIFKIPKEDTVRAVLDAIEVGYRHFDTAQSYMNEEELGTAIRQSGIPRKEFFITTKVWLEHFGEGKTEKSLERSLKRLQTDYIDLVLLHQPFNDIYAAWRDLEKMYKADTLKAIGLSNFEPDRMLDLMMFNDVKPQVNQLETNPFCQQQEAQAFMKEKGVQPAAWAPFGEGNTDIFTNPILKQIAENHGKSIPQVILRWLTQRDIVVLSKSSKKERMAENFNIFDFALTDDEMKAVASLDTGKSTFFDITDTKTVAMFGDLVAQRKGLT